jgi:DNA-binding GntR family transcriptional regulator
MRAVVFGFACQRLSSRLTEAQSEELSDLIARMDQAIARSDNRGYYELNLAFHDAVIGFAAHGRAKQVYESLINETHLFRQRALGLDDSMKESNAEHAAILDALKARGAERARRLGEEHSLAGKRRWLEALTR